MATSDSPQPVDPRRPDPLTMTAAEKVMAEWEARHDVIARGSRATPGAIQHYLAESRSKEACDRAAELPPPRPPPPAHPAAGRGAQDLLVAATRALSGVGPPGQGGPGAGAGG